MTESKKNTTTTKSKTAKPVHHKEPVEVVRTCKYTFSDKELADMAVDLTRNLREKTNMEDELQGIKSSFKGKIDASVAQINKVSTDYGNGYDYRSMKCTLSFDFTGKRRVYRRNDTGAIVADEPMPASDLQTDAFVAGG